MAKRILKKKYSKRADLECEIRKAIEQIPIKMVQESVKKFLPRFLSVEKNISDRIDRKFK